MKLNAVTYHCMFQTSKFNGKGFEKGQDLGPSEAGGPDISPFQVQSNQQEQGYEMKGSGGERYKRYLLFLQ